MVLRSEARVGSIKRPLITSLANKCGGIQDHTAVNVGSVNLRKTSLISFAGNRILLSNHQFNTSTNVDAIYEETSSGGICRAGCRPNRKSLLIASAMISMRTFASVHARSSYLWVRSCRPTHAHDDSGGRKLEG